MNIAESLPTPGDLGSALQSGVQQIGRVQKITFIRYTRVVLPIDGYVFWVNSNLLDPPAPYLPVIHAGSLHFATDNQQREDETIGINRVIFTAENEIDDFNEISPTVCYIGSWEGIRFSFTRRRSFYKQAALWHYEGDAIYPAMEPLVIDNIDQLDLDNVVVSNSLPIWLAILTPQAWPQPPRPTFPLYPSFAVPDNLRPPYATVHIVPEGTDAIQAAPAFNSVGSHFQLSVDQVRITLYGVRNDQALDFQDWIYQYMIDTSDLGLLDQQVMQDAKRTQSELNILAIKKVFNLRVSYNQMRVRDIAIQYILHAIPAFLPSDQQRVATLVDGAGHTLVDGASNIFVDR